MALSLWPWHWAVDVSDNDSMDEDGLRTSEEDKSEETNSESQMSQDENHDKDDELAKSVPSFWIRLTQSIDWPNRLRRCLLLAALACILRPTNLLIWICIASFALLRRNSQGRMLSLPWEGMQVWMQITSLSLLPATKKERIVLLRDTALCGYGLHKFFICYHQD